ncbi:MAG: nucleoside triphosphate pyrophosphohydrolase [Desulfobacterales bacterium]|nr:nucleoside triphosphate pyrophosphohydrolase [Desulfobacterales bacterium]
MEATQLKTHADEKIESIIHIIERLRGENGCPWDKVQTIDTASRFLVEEVYELLAAIEANDTENICEELGDVLFQVCFIIALYKESGHFSLADIVTTNTDKMIRRHPHVFGNESVTTPEEVKKRWDKIKQHERSEADQSQSIVDTIPKKLPPLYRSYLMIERIVRAGIQRLSLMEVIEDIDTQWMGLKNQIESKLPISEAIGQMVFSLTQLAWIHHVHPETELNHILSSFEQKVRQIEAKIKTTHT